MLGEDLIHAASHSRVKTPKHVGLAVTLHHITGSKEVVTLLNRMGHCSSYDEVEIVNTSWAKEITARSEEIGVVVPSNISVGVFTQFAADNNDLNEDTLDGKQTTHATTIVAYQREQFGPKPPPKVHADHSAKRRSLDQPVHSQAIQECSITGERPAVRSFLDKVQEKYFVSQIEPQDCIDQRDFAWFLLRLDQRDVLVSVMNRQYLVGVLSMLKCHRTSLNAPLLDIAQWYTARRQSTAPFTQCSKTYKI